jgi:N-hydroxyarylamine O-acetyltransferase
MNDLFRKRINLPQNEEITFEKLSTVLAKTAQTIPFENLCIISKNTQEITSDNLVQRILHQNEGGLCYDLNTLLYLFLKENGFDVRLVRGIVYNQMEKRWSYTGKTHVTIILTHDGKEYLVDTGFGGNIPLTPVPLTGEVVTSNNGEFKVERTASEHGDYFFNMKLKHKDQDWKVGYAFDSTYTVVDLAELNQIQKTIIEHPDSAFNKRPLVTRLTDQGNAILTDTFYTEWVDGSMEKRDVDPAEYKRLLKEQFGL